MVFALCVAKGKNGVTLSHLEAQARFGLPKYAKSLGYSGKLSKWFVGEYKTKEVLIYAEDIVSEVDDLSDVSLILPVKDGGGYSDAYVLGPAFICLSYKSKRGIGKGDSLNKDVGFSEWFSTHAGGFHRGRESAALLMPDFGGDYKPDKLKHLNKTS